jgi:hypothetical protein
MKHGRIGNESAMREAAQIRTLISDLDRIVQFLNFDIATEEKHGGYSTAQILCSPECWQCAETILLIPSLRSKCA